MRVSILSQTKPRLGRHIAVHEPGMPILSVEHLTVEYGPVKAFGKYQLLTRPGRSSGCGRSQWSWQEHPFKVIAGLLTPTDGVARIAGHEPNGHLCIAYIPQRSQVDWNFPVSVANVVMMGRTGRLGLLRWPGKTDRAIVQQALEVVKLDKLQDRQISERFGRAAAAHVHRQAPCATG